jgi:hypothetical protein
MDWELAIEKTHGALKRVLAMLVGLVGMSEPGTPGEPREPDPSRSLAPPSVLSFVEGPDISPTRGEISSGAPGLSPSAIGCAVGDRLISPLVGTVYTERFWDSSGMR